MPEVVKAGGVLLLSESGNNFPAMVKLPFRPSPHLAVALALVALAGSCQSPEDSTPGSRTDPDTPLLREREAGSGSTLFRVQGLSPEHRREDGAGVEGPGGSWETLADLPEARQGAGLASVGGQLYLAGGTMSGGAQGEGPQPAFPLWVYEPSQDRWDTPTILEEPVRGPLLVGIHQHLLVVGGWAPVDGGGWTPSRAVWRYDPDPRLWTSGASLPPGVSLMGGGVVEGRLHVVGTVEAGTRPVHLSYDPASDQWEELSPPPSRVLDASVAAVGEYLLVAGGRMEGGLPEPDVFSYDSRTDVWEAVAPLPLGRAEAVAVSMDGWLYLVGGDVATPDGGLRTTWRVDRFNPHQNLWQRLEPAPGAPGEAWAAVAGHLHGIGSTEPGFAASHQRFRPPS